MVQIKLSVAFVLAVAAIAPVIALPAGPKPIDGSSEVATPKATPKNAPKAEARKITADVKDSDDHTATHVKTHELHKSGVTGTGRHNHNQKAHKENTESKDENQHTFRTVNHHKTHPQDDEHPEHKAHPQHKGKGHSVSDSSPTVMSREDDDGLFERFFDDFEPRDVTSGSATVQVHHVGRHNGGHHHANNHNGQTHTYNNNNYNNGPHRNHHGAGVVQENYARKEVNNAPSAASNLNARDYEMYVRSFGDDFEYEAREYDDLD